VALSLVSGQHATQQSSAGVTFAFPSTPTVGNLVLLIASWGNGSSNTITPPAGLTQIGSTVNNGTTIGAAAWLRTFQAGDTNSYAFTQSGTANFSVVGVEITGEAATSIINGQSIVTFTSTTTPASPSVTPSINGCLAIVFFAANGSSQTYTAGSGWTVNAHSTNNKSVALTSLNTLTSGTSTGITETATIGVAGVGVTGTILIAPAGALVASPSTLNFATSSASPQTSTISGGVSPYSIVSSPDGSIATASLTSGTLTVSPVGPGSTTCVIQDSGSTTVTVNINVASGNVILSPSLLNFALPTSATQTVNVSEVGYVGVFNLTSNNTAVCTVPGTADGSGNFVVTPVGAGSTTITVADTNGVSMAVTVNVASGTINCTPSTLLFLSQTDPAKTFVASQTGYTQGFTVADLSPFNTRSTIGTDGVTVTVTPLLFTASSNVRVTDAYGRTQTVAVTIYKGTVTLTPTSLTFNNSSASNQNLTASETIYPGAFTAVSSNTAVATIGTISGSTIPIHPVGAGTSVITVSDANGHSATANVTVYGSLNVSPLSLTFKQAPSGATLLIEVSETAYTNNFTVVSSNTAVATVPSSTYAGPGPIQIPVTAVGAGTATITVSDNHGNSATVNVSDSFNPLAVSTNTLNFASSAAATQSFQVTGGVNPYTVTSNNTGICTVSPPDVNGNVTVTPVAAGTTTISIVDSNIPQASQTVTVNVASTTIIPNPGSISFATSGSPPVTITASEVGYAGTFAFSSSAPSVATVGASSGIVTPVSAGTSTITITDTFGHTATVPVTVSSGLVVLTKTILSFATPSSAMQTSVASESGYGGVFTASSSNTAIATVTMNGDGVTVQVTPHAAGFCTITVQDASAHTATIAVNVASGTIVVNPTTLTFASPSGTQNVAISETGYLGTFSANSSNLGVVSVSVTGNTLSVIAVGFGSATVTVSDLNSNTATVTVTVLSGNIILSPSPLVFTTPTAAAQAVGISQGGYGGSYTAAISNPTIATEVIAGTTVTVTPVSVGTTLLTVTDTFGHSAQMFVTVNQGDAFSESLLLKFTGFLETDQQKVVPFGNTKTANVVDLTKQFRFDVYDTLPHPLFGDQTFAAFDPAYNLTNPNGDGKTWVCDGKMFTTSSASPLYGASHKDIAVFVDGTGGTAPSNTAVSSTGYSITGTIGTCTNYTFDYNNGILTFTSAGLTAIGYPSGLPGNAVVSLQGNPTYMAPEVMIRKLLVEKADWSPLFLQLDTSNVLLPQYLCEDKTIWNCIQEIVGLTCPRFIPWVIWQDNNGVIKFYESRWDGPPVKTFLDERDLLTLDPVFDASQLITVVRANGSVATSSGNQPITSIAYDIQSINRYGQTQPMDIASYLTLPVQNLSPTAAQAWLNTMTWSVLAQVSRPVLTITCEIWPDPRLEVSDKIAIRSKKTGIYRDFIIKQIDEELQSGDYKQTIRAEELYDAVNYSVGIANIVSQSTSQAATVALPSTTLIGAVQLGNFNGVGTYAIQSGDFVVNPQTLERILPIWDCRQSASPVFNIYLNGLPATGQVPPNLGPVGMNQQWNYYNLPPGYSWVASINPVNNNTVYYGVDPGDSKTVYVGPDSVFYKFNHAPPITSSDSSSFWVPPGNTQNPALGGNQGYTSQSTTVYVWAWFYLCLDGSAGSGKIFRPAMRINPAQDAVAQSVPSAASNAVGGLWLTNTWTGGPGPKTSGTTANYNKFYGNIVAGISNATITPPGFVSANVMGDGVQMGVAFGGDMPPGMSYVGFQKKTNAHFCIYAMSNQGAVQFLRVPFQVIV